MEPYLKYPSEYHSELEFHINIWSVLCDFRDTARVNTVNFLPRLHIMLRLRA